MPSPKEFNYAFLFLYIGHLFTVWSGQDWRFKVLILSNFNIFWPVRSLSNTLLTLIYFLVFISFHTNSLNSSKGFIFLLSNHFQPYKTEYTIICLLIIYQKKSRFSWHDNKFLFKNVFSFFIGSSLAGENVVLNFLFFS